MFFRPRGPIFAAIFLASVLSTASVAYAQSTFNPTVLVNTESFEIIDQGDATTDVELRFGQTAGQKVLYDRTNGRFKITRSLYIAGTLTTTGAAIINVGNTSAVPDTGIALEILGTASGRTLHAQDILNSSGSLVIKKYAGSSTGTILLVDSKGLVYDATNKRIGIGTSSPVATLDVNGTIENSLVGWWPMDEGVGTYFADKSINAASNSSGAFLVSNGWTTGKFGKGTQFNGSNYAVIKHSTALSPSVMTVSFWLKTNSLASDRLILSKGKAAASRSYWFYENSGIQFGMGAIVSSQITPAMVTDNNWHHIVGTYDGTNLNIYLDGNVIGTPVAAPFVSASGDIGIGAYSDGSFFSNPKKLDDLRIYSRVLSNREIADLYRNNPLGIGGAISTTLVIESGASLKVSGTMSGGSLTVTNLLSCSSLQTNSAGALSCGSGSSGNFGSGNVLAIGDRNYVNVSGDTMTGALSILKRAGTATGNTLVVDSKGLVYDATNKRVGIGTSSPATTFHVPAKMPTTTLGIVNTTSAVGGVAIQGRYVYAARATVLQVIDVKDPSTPTVIASLTMGTQMSEISVQGNYAYIVDNADGLHIVDISKPNAPKKVATLASATGLDLIVQGRYAYISVINTLKIVDIANPAAPVQLGSTVTNINSPTDLTVRGNYAYIANYSSNNILVFDVSNPTNPLNVGSVTLNQPRQVTTQGNYLYASSGGYLAVLDASNPLAPSVVGAVKAEIGYFGGDFIVQGRYVYMTDDYGYFHIVDVTTPTAPTLVGSFSFGSQLNAMAIQGRYAYVASPGSGFLYTLDLGGSYQQNIEAGLMEVGGLSVMNYLSAYDGDFKGGLQVGKGIDVHGQSAIVSTSTGSANYALKITSSSGALQIAAQGNVGKRHITFGSGSVFDVSLFRSGVNTLRTDGTFVASALTVTGLSGCNTIDTDVNGVMTCGTDEGGAGSGISQGAGDLRFVNNAGDTMTGGLLIQTTTTHGTLPTIDTGIAFEVAGVMSGASLAVTSLRNCDTIDTDANGLMTCGTDSGGSGISQTAGDLRYVNAAGDTMTGGLLIQGTTTHGTLPTIDGGTLLEVAGTASGKSLRFVSGYFTATGATMVPLTVREAVSHSANLTEWQTSDGTILLSVPALSPSNEGAIVFYAGGTAVMRLRYHSGYLDNVNAAQNALYPFRTGDTGINYTPDGSAGLAVKALDAADKTLFIQGISAQTGYLTEWQNVDGLQLGYVDVNGNMEMYTASGRIIHAQDLLTSSGQLVVTGNVKIDGSTFFADTSTNKVGIGTLIPETTLEVIGTMSGRTLHAQNKLESSGALVVRASGKTTPALITDIANTRVGIGKAAPAVALEAVGTISGSLITQNGAGNNYMLGNLVLGGTANPASAKLNVIGTMSGQGLNVGGGATVTRIYSATATLDFANMGTANTCAADQTITVNGAVDGDVVSVGVPAGSVVATGKVWGWVSAANTVTVRYCIDGTTGNPASGTFRVMVTHF